MHFSDINISALILNVYSNDKKYSCDYSAEPRPFHSIALLLEGSGALHCGSKKIPLETGDVFFIPRRTVYKSEWTPGENGKIVMFTMHFQFLTEPEEFSGRAYPTQKAIKRQSAEEFARLVKEYRELQKLLLEPKTEGFGAAGRFFLLLEKLLPLFYYEKNEYSSEKIAPALQKIAQNPAADLSVDELAALCYVSKPRFFALFKKFTGTSPMAYKNAACMEAAAKYLISFSNRSVEEIAYEFRFSSPVYFARLFKKHFGVSPSAYRKSVENDKL